MTKKKSPPKTKIEVSESEDILTPDEVKELVFNFQQFSSQLNRGNFPGVLNPLLLNQKMQDVNLNPIVATDDILEKALKKPKENEETLQGLSEYFEIISQPYKRLISYLSNMLSWDMTMTCINATEEDYKSEGYKKELKKVESMLDRFDYQKEFGIIVREMLRNDMFLGCPRFDSDQIVIQELPASVNHSKITGRWSHGFLASFNFLYFLQPGVDINMYSPFFVKKYGELWDNTDKKYHGYNPTLPPEVRGNSSWVYWVDLPVSDGWVWKLSPELSSRIPYFTGLFSDLILQPLMRNLQKNTNLAAAAKILAGEVPFLQNTGAKVKDALAMSPDVLAKFLQLVSSALVSAIKVTAAPLANMQALSFAGDNDLYPTYLKNMLAASGVNTSLIFTSETRPNILESRLSVETDEQLMTSVYPSFNQFMNYNFNVGKKYKWRFEFQGTKFSTNREDRWNRQKDLMESGFILPQQISAAIGMRYTDFKRQLAEGRADGIVEKLTPIIKASQMGADKAGRPASADSKLGDSGAQTREQGSNVAKGGKK